METQNKAFHEKDDRYNCNICGYKVSHMKSLARYKKLCTIKSDTLASNAAIKQPQARRRQIPLWAMQTSSDLKGKSWSTQKDST